jgi:pimeloyl-ACP methyl ester carboxylesterase
VFDWPGSGRSVKPSTAFGYDEMVEGALAVIRASEAQRVVPVAQAHAGWAAIELRRRRGERIPKLVLDPPPLFLAAIEAAQDPARWQEARPRLRHLARGRDPF